MSLRESFPQNRKITYPIIKDKKVTYSNLSHLNYEEREHVFEKIPLKSYKKCLSYISFGKDSKIHKSLTKASKRCFHNSQCLSLIQCFPVKSILAGAIKACKKFACT